MSGTLRVAMGFSVILYFLIIFHFLKKKTLSLKYSLLWIVTGMVMTILVIFPKALDMFVKAIGIQTPVNGLFAVCIFFIILILMSLTSIVSKQTERIKNLTQYLAIEEKKQREAADKVYREEKKECGRKEKSNPIKG